MFNRVILLDYDVGALGNSIYALLALTSSNVLSESNENFKFNANGNAHNINKFVGFANGTFDYSLDRLIPVGQFDIRIGHAWSNYKSVHDKLPESHFIKIICRPFGFIYQTLAGYQKFAGKPTLDTASRYYNILGNSETECIESYALCYYGIMQQHKEYAKDNTINIVWLDDVVNSNLQVVIDFFEQKFDFVFDLKKVDNYIKDWKEVNKSLLDRSHFIYNLIQQIDSGHVVDFPNNLEFYEKSMILACVAKEHIADMPIYTESNFWANSSILLNSLKK
jgi:hypothetical protein